MRSFLTGTLAAAATLGSVSASCAQPRTATHSYSTGNGTYDYIIVGGGPSGIIAATRLAQSSGKSVLLLSRGPGPTVATGATTTVGWNDSLTPIDVPGLSTSLGSYTVDGEALGTSYYCTDVIGSNTACVFGGGASFNYMVFPHPPERDFDDKWPVGWKWDDVSEAADRVWSLNPGSSLPSQDGQRYDQGMFETVSEFLDAQGWSLVDSAEEPNEKTKVYSYPHWDIGNTMRVGPLRTYLPLVEGQSNFEYKTDSLVRRVIRDGSTVTGVEVESDSGNYTVNLSAGGKVILAAGPWGTPRVLFNSGIGPAEQIQTVANGTTGITLPPQKDWIELPVGQAVKDHTILEIMVQTPANWTSYNMTGVVAGTETDTIDLYEKEGSGVLSQGYHRMIFWTSNVASDNVTRYYQGSVSPQGEGLFLLMGYLTHGATSQGKMGISADGSVSFTEKPYLATEADREGATMFVNEMLEAITAYGWEAAEGYTNVTEILENYVQGNHHVGAAALGTDSQSSVINKDDLKVWGTDNLYVVDSSIHADLPTGNTQAITMVVAEKAIEKIIAAESNSTVARK